MTKGRWRVLLKRLDVDSDRILDTIIACCVLHNICILRDEVDIDDSDDDDSDDDDNDSAPPPPQLRPLLRFYKPLFDTLQYPLDFVLVAF